MKLIEKVNKERDDQKSSRSGGSGRIELLDAARRLPLFDIKGEQASFAVELRRRLEVVLDHCQFILGPEVAELEERLAAWCGARHCVGVGSGTDALLIALMAEGVGERDAIFLPAFTYTATAEVPLLVGAVPVFVDIDPRTFQIDPDDLVRRIAAVRRGGKLRPRALIGVDLFGQPADWAVLGEIGRAEGLFLLDDAAQSFGASFHNRRLGTFGDATAVSFFPTKPLGGYGDGGALFTESNERAALYRSLRSHGEGTTRYEVLRIGINGRLDTLQAAVLLARFTRFDAALAARERIARCYDRALAGLVETPARVPDSTSAWAIYSVLLPDSATRARVQQALAAGGIGSNIYYPRPLHRQPAYRAHHDGTSLPVADSVSERILALPMHPGLEEADVTHIAEVMQSALAL